MLCEINFLFDHTNIEYVLYYLLCAICITLCSSYCMFCEGIIYYGIPVMRFAEQLILSINIQDAM